MLELLQYGLDYQQVLIITMRKDNKKNNDNNFKSKKLERQLKVTLATTGVVSFDRLKLTTRK